MQSIYLNVRLDPTPNPLLLVLRVLWDVQREPSLEVHVLERDLLRPVPNLVPQQQHKEEGNAKVRRDEARGVEAVNEIREAREHNDDDGHDEPIPAQVRLQGSAIRQRGAVDALPLESFVKPDARVQDDGPGQHAAHGAHVGKVSERGASRRVVRGSKEGQRCEHGANADADPRQTVRLARLAEILVEEAGRDAAHVESIQRATGDVEVADRRAPRTSQEGGVHDRG
ncbi:hypothetical protein A1Q2_07643 [Trichosporon asahii var. asahii CBS 8904]|uniref:Uncharacterized protein n=1 Tax=Trichosporon asahii var. asahii (strain CBS 8904) TaxID=1220162 RepID=K1VN38_TRIAC|nr:hypothetical protein A1Q2_07643 [Trichosporon asahii var. asahii CBS 8904]